MRAADDFVVIRRRVQELKRERAAQGREQDDEFDWRHVQQMEEEWNARFRAKQAR